MEAGTGQDSYCRNSSYQAQGFKHVQKVIEQAIVSNSVLLDSSLEVIQIADLGCGSSSNSITALSFVARVITELRKQNLCPPIQIHASFSDMTSNDFNTLFSLVPHFQGDPYFFSAVPGSFYRRLFPRSSVHFMMTNFALQLLSKVPDVIMDKSSEAWNGDATFVDRFSPPAAIEAYTQQADDDLRDFLRYRSQEMVTGGALSLMFIIRPTQELQKSELAFQNAWKELIKEGIASQESLDSFNFPAYYRTHGEIYAALQSFEQEFKVVLEKTLPLPPLEQCSGTWKAISKGFVAKHIGNDKVVELIYERTASMRTEEPEEACHKLGIILLLLLKR